MVTMKHCIVTPKKYRFITGILPMNKKIEGPMELDLNTKEIKRCMMNGAVVQIITDGSLLELDEKNYYLEENKSNTNIHPPIPLDEIAKIGEAEIGEAKIYPIY